MTVSDPTAFVADAEAKQGVRKGLAKVVSLPEDFISVTLSVSSRRLLAGKQRSSRRLQTGGVDVSYEIVVPESSVVEAEEVRDVLVSASTDVTDLAESITSSVNDVKGEGIYLMVVASIEAPSAIEETLISQDSTVTESKNTSSEADRGPHAALVSFAYLIVIRLLLL